MFWPLGYIFLMPFQKKFWTEVLRYGSPIIQNNPLSPPSECSNAQLTLQMTKLYKTKPQRMNITCCSTIQLKQKSGPSERAGLSLSQNYVVRQELLSQEEKKLYIEFYHFNFSADRKHLELHFKKIQDNPLAKQLKAEKEKKRYWKHISMAERALSLRILRQERAGGLSRAGAWEQTRTLPQRFLANEAQVSALFNLCK